MHIYGTSFNPVLIASALRFCKVDWDNKLRACPRVMMCLSEDVGAPLTNSGMSN